MIGRRRGLMCSRCRRAGWRAPEVPPLRKGLPRSRGAACAAPAPGACDYHFRIPGCVFLPVFPGCQSTLPSVPSGAGRLIRRVYRLPYMVPIHVPVCPGCLQLVGLPAGVSGPSGRAPFSDAQELPPVIPSGVAVPPWPSAVGCACPELHRTRCSALDWRQAHIVTVCPPSAPPPADGSSPRSPAPWP